MMATHPPGPQTRSISATAGLAAMRQRGGEGRAGDDQVGEIVGQRQLVEEPADHLDLVPVAGCR